MVGGLGAPERVKEMLEDSVNFGINPTLDTVETFRDASVDYYILDKWVLDGATPDTFFSDNLFENERFVVIRLTA